MRKISGFLILVVICVMSIITVYANHNANYTITVNKATNCVTDYK